MYEKEAVPTMADNGTPQKIRLAQFQSEKRLLAEETLEISEKIIGNLIGQGPDDTKSKQDINCLMDDLLSERATLEKLHKNLFLILDFLGA